MTERHHPERRQPSEPLSQAAAQALMDDYMERLFVHGSSRQQPDHIVTPQEVQFDFNTKAVQKLLEQLSNDSGIMVAEAYAVYERDSEAAQYDAREARGESVVIIINKLLTASDAKNQMYQNTWYTFTAYEPERVTAAYEYEFIQGDRPVMTTGIATSMEERLFQAMRGSSDRHRPLFQDDVPFLRALLDMIGR